VLFVFYLRQDRDGRTIEVIQKKCFDTIIIQKASTDVMTKGRKSELCFRKELASSDFLQRENFHIQLYQMNIIDNITPNEKRMRLFNVNEPTELPIEEFEKKLVAAG